MAQLYVAVRGCLLLYLTLTHIRRIVKPVTHEEFAALPPAPTQPRLPEIYTSPDKTVEEVASRRSPHVGSPRRQQSRLREHFGPLATIAVNPEVLRRARELAEHDLGRLVFQHDGSVIVANSTAHARLIREHPAFDTPTPDEVR